MNITTLEELKKIGEGEIVELPAFENGTKLIARLRKPNVTTMIINGKIPNPLIEVAMNMTEKGRIDLYKENQDDNSEKAIDIEKTKRYFEFLNIVAKECLVSPTFNEIQEYVGGLNIEQLIEIFKYSQSEVENLKSFRSE